MKWVLFAFLGLFTYQHFMHKMEIVRMERANLILEMQLDSIKKHPNCPKIDLQELCQPRLDEVRNAFTKKLSELSCEQTECEKCPTWWDLCQD
jgi:hypothetical protein